MSFKEHSLVQNGLPALKFMSTCLGYELMSITVCNIAVQFGRVYV